MADSLGIQEGDVLYSQVDMYNNLVGIIDLYNMNVDPSQWLSKYAIQPGSVDQRIHIPCRAVHIGNESYGKFPKYIVED